MWRARARKPRVCTLAVSRREGYELSPGAIRNTAPGIDCIVMLLVGEENLREVTMFTVTQ